MDWAVTCSSHDCASRLASTTVHEDLVALVPRKLSTEPIPVRTREEPMVGVVWSLGCQLGTQTCHTLSRTRNRFSDRSTNFRDCSSWTPWNTLCGCFGLLQRVLEHLELGSRILSQHFPFSRWGHCTEGGRGSRMTSNQPSGTSNELHPLRGMLRRLTWEQNAKTTRCAHKQHNVRSRKEFLEPKWPAELSFFFWREKE